MTFSELIEYLHRFKPDEQVAVVSVDIEKRIAYKVSAYMLIDEMPALLLEASGSGPLNEIAEEKENSEFERFDPS